MANKRDDRRRGDGAPEALRDDPRVAKWVPLLVPLAGLLLTVLVFFIGSEILDRIT